MTHTPFRLIQISDCHLSASPDSPYRGQSADAGLAGLVERVGDWRPDRILASGDLSEDASDASYQRLSKFFRRMQAPVCALPGNHDEAPQMARYFPEGPWRGPLILPAGRWRLVLLNSAIHGRIDGALSTVELEKVDQWLRRNPAQPVLLALHHQPVTVGSAWIDRHMLREPEDLLELVQCHEQVRVVTWGHVHQAFESRHGHAHLFSCPSTAVNSRPMVERFTADSAGPACRWFELHENGEFGTGLLYPRSPARQDQPQDEVNQDAGKSG